MTGSSTGGDPVLTPLNLLLVSISLPDEPAVEPEPEPAVVIDPSPLPSIYDYLSFDSTLALTDIRGTSITDQVASGGGNSNSITTDSKLGAGALQADGEARLEFPSSWADFRGQSFLIWGWAKHPTSGAGTDLIRKNSNTNATIFVLRRQPSNSTKLRLIVGFSDGSSVFSDTTTDPSFDEYFFFAFTWDRVNKTVELWINGQSQFQINVPTGTDLAAPGPITYIHDLNTNGPSYRNLDEVGLSATAGSQEIIDFLYNDGAGRTLSEIT